MSALALPPAVVLLIEDNLADADLVEAYLNEAAPEYYVVCHVTCLAAAVSRLRQQPVVDVVLLDLYLPDGEGVQSVTCLRTVAEDVPIVVLTGLEDEAFALGCIQAGAQDYLYKGELGAQGLRRSLGYAIGRGAQRRELQRAAQVRELQDILARYRALASTMSGTTITTALTGAGAVRERHPQVFHELVQRYGRLLDVYLEQMVIKKDKPIAAMEHVITRLGDLGAGPRDLMEVHTGALEQVVQGQNDMRARTLMVEGRLFALEMMGLLVDYYRVGTRRHCVAG